MVTLFLKHAVNEEIHAGQLIRMEAVQVSQQLIDAFKAQNSLFYLVRHIRNLPLVHAGETSKT